MFLFLVNISNFRIFISEFFPSNYPILTGSFFSYFSRSRFIILFSLLDFPRQIWLRVVITFFSLLFNRYYVIWFLTFFSFFIEILDSLFHCNIISLKINWGNVYQNNLKINYIMIISEWNIDHWNLIIIIQIYKI